MADPGTPQKYLALNPSVEGDPRVASLPARLYKLFISLRLMALNSDEPGVVDLTWSAFCECHGIRKPAAQARYAEMLEQRRLIGFRLSTEFGYPDDCQVIVIARWTMPQLDVQGFRRADMPRRQYPSDAPGLRRRGSQANPQTSTDETRSEAVPCPVAAEPMAQFFTETPRVAESLAEEGGVVAESAKTTNSLPNKERKENNKTKRAATPPVTPQPVLTAEQIVVAASLQAEGIHSPTAEMLVRQGATAESVEKEIALLDTRNVRDNRAGFLRRAIEASLAGHPYQPPNRHKDNSLRRKVFPRAAAVTRMAEGAPPPMASLRGALRSSAALTNPPV